MKISLNVAQVMHSLSRPVKGLADLAEWTREENKTATDFIEKMTDEQLRDKIDFRTNLRDYEDEGRAIEDLAHICKDRRNGVQLFWSILTDAFRQDYHCLGEVLEKANARNVLGSLPQFLEPKALERVREIVEDPEFIPWINKDVKIKHPKGKKGPKPAPAMKK